MLNVSNEFRKFMEEDKRNFFPYAKITLADGTDLGTLDKAQIWESGFKINDGVTASGQFTIGSCIINKLTLVLNNIYDDYSEYDFDRAKITAFVGLELSGGKIERIQKGVFTVDDPKYDGALITLECLDNMHKFDVDYSSVKTVFPATIGTIIRDMCSFCDVSLLTAAFEGADTIIDVRPDDENLTCRQMLLYCCQRICKFARCDVYGRLEIKWFDQETLEIEKWYDGGSFRPWTKGDIWDGGTFVPWTTGETIDGGTFADLKKFHHFHSDFSLTVSTDDVVITGVQVTEEFQETEEAKKATYLYGSEGYVLAVSGNPLIPAGKAEEAAAYLGQRLIGLRFRPMSGTFLGDPTVEAGDLAHVTDYKQNTYNCLITNLSFAIGDSMQASCDAETPRKNSSKRYSELTRAVLQSRRETEQRISEYDRTVQEMTQLISMGFGMYFTKEPQESGGFKWYMHDQPTIKESSYVCQLTSNGILASLDGGTTWAVDKNGNALFNVIVARGLHAEWITAGRFVVADPDGNIMFLADVDTGEVQISLSSMIDGESLGTRFSIINSAITSEISRAKGEEGNLSSKITQTEASLSSTITETVKGERERAEGAEKTLSSNITQSAEKISTEVSRATAAEGILRSSIEQNAEAIKSKVTAADVSSLISRFADEISFSVVNGKLGSQATFSLLVGDKAKATANLDLTKIREAFQNDPSVARIAAGKVQFVSNTFSVTSTNFSVTEDGTITANAGSIAGWTIKTNRLEKDNVASGGYRCGIQNSSSSSSSVFFAGCSTAAGGTIVGNSNFYVTQAGYLFSRSGKIGGWTIGESSLTSDGGKLVIGHATLSSESNAFTIRQGLHLYTGTSGTFDDGSRSFKLYGLSHVTSGGHLVFGQDGATVSYLSSSSARYKIIDGELQDSEIENLYNIKVMWARYKDTYLSETDERYGRLMPMFIAEDIDRYIPIAVDHRDGQPETWNERILIPYMFQMIKNLHEKNLILQQRLCRVEQMMEG